MQQFVGNKPKGQISKGCCKKTKHAKFSKKKFFYPLIRKRTYAYQGGKECLFFGKSSVLSFLVSSVMRFALLPYCRQIVFKHPPVRLKTPIPGRHLLVQSQHSKHQNNAWNLFKVYNEDTRMTPLKSLWCLYF